MLSQYSEAHSKILEIQYNLIRYYRRPIWNTFDFILTNGDPSHDRCSNLAYILGYWHIMASELDLTSGSEHQLEDIGVS